MRTGLTPPLASTYTLPGSTRGVRTTAYTRDFPYASETCVPFSGNVTNTAAATTLSWPIAMLSAVTGPDSQTLLALSSQLDYITNTVLRSADNTNYLFTTVQTSVKSLFREKKSRKLFGRTTVLILEKRPPG